MSTKTSPFYVAKTVEVQQTVKKKIQMIDWSKVPDGTYMTAKINGVLHKGVILKDGSSLYFCQNTKSGNNGTHKFGFKYSWNFHQNSDGTHTDEVKDIQFPPKPARLKIVMPPPTIKVGDYEAKIFKDKIEVGCQTISKAQVKAVWTAMNKIK